MEYNYINQEQIDQALEYQKNQTGKKTRLGALLTEMGFVTEKQVLQAMCRKLDLSMINLDDYEVDIEVIQKIPKSIAEKYNVIAVSERNGRIQLVMDDPLNFYAQEDIRQIVDSPLEVLLCESDRIKKAIDYFYAEISTKQAALSANESMEDLNIPDMDIDDVDDDVPIIKLINSLLVRGYSTNTSDIHIEPMKDLTVVRMRIDGEMIKYLTLQKQLHNSIVARIKIMSNMNIAEKRIPQDGNFHAVIEGIELSMRVSVLPTTHGEKVVMRYLTSDTRIDNAGHFGMNETNYQLLMKMMNAPNGIIYITGPTGSGKTTTLYMVLQHLSQRPVNISTIEDPVERDLPNITQTSVNVQAGMTFAVGLRALLRQDPDIIMIGETRDAETAEISVRSAITGHLVVSTLHTNDAISSIVRLSDMGIPNYMIANSVVGIVAQRLVRKVCQFCKEMVPATEEDKLIIGDQIPMVARGKGCKACNGTGYKGRISIHEMVYIDRKMKRLIASGATSDEMKDYAVENQGMKNLMDSCLQLVAEGITSPEEAQKISYYSD